MSTWRKVGYCLIAAVAAFAARAELTAQSYVQRGLTAHFDGKENAGYGQYDGTATAWVDLRGGASWTLNSHGSWSDGALVCDGKGHVSKMTAAQKNVYTAEIRFEPTFATVSSFTKQPVWISGQAKSQTGSEAYFYIDWNNGNPRLSFGNKTGYDGGVLAADLAQTWCATYKVSSGVSTSPLAGYCNGEYKAFDIKAMDYINASGDSCTLGGRFSDDRVFAGKIYAMRLYNRVLAPDEIWLNAAIDEARFFGETCVRYVFTVAKPGTQYVDKGGAAEPKPPVSGLKIEVSPDGITSNDVQLVEGVHYEYSWSGNTEPGEGTVTVTGIGDCAGSTASATFTVEPRFAVSLAMAEPATCYPASAEEPAESRPEVTATVIDRGAAVFLTNVVALVEGVDFDYSFADTSGYGTATVTATGREGTAYEGLSVAKSYAKRPRYATLDEVLAASSYLTAEAADTFSVFDGIENTGLGQAHDATASVWKDLAGDRDLTLTAKGSWAEGRMLKFSGCAAKGEAKGPAYETIEAVFRCGSNPRKQFLYANGEKPRLIALHQNGEVQFCAGKAGVLKCGSHADLAPLRICAATYADGTVPNTGTYLNGAPQKNSLLSLDDWAIGDGVMMVGDRAASGSYALTAQLYALRLYARPLTAVEIRDHAALDKARFDDDFSEVGNFGIAPIGETPTYGAEGPAEPHPAVYNRYTGAALAEGVDYEQSYSNNLETGVAWLYLTGKGDYEGQYGCARYAVRRERFVKADGASDASGSSWETAQDLASAVSAAKAGDVLRLAAGGYAGSCGSQFAGAVELRGGYAATEGRSLALADGRFPRTTLDCTGASGASYVFYFSSNDSAATNVLERIAVCNMPAGVSAVAKGNGSQMRVVDCDFVGGTNYAPIRQTGGFLSMSGCRFLGNTVGLDANYGQGVVRLTTAKATTRSYGASLDHCIFAGNRLANGGAAADSASAGLVYCAYYSAATTVDVDCCTFAYNLSDTVTAPAGVFMASGAATIRNSVFSGAQFASLHNGDEYLGVSTTGAVDVDYSLFDRAKGDAESPLIVRGDHVKYDAALFATTAEEFAALVVAEGGRIAFADGSASALAALDLHARSTKGYCLNDGTWTKSDGAYSSTIDAGDPDAACDDEPDPNGSCLNLGAYGNTVEASKSSTAKPFIASVAVSWPDGLTIPAVTVTLGDEGEAYTADVEVRVASSAEAAQRGEWLFSDRAETLREGSVNVFDIGSIFNPGDPIYVMATVSSVTSQPASMSTEDTAKGVLPAWAGKGGGAKVLHVWANARGAAVQDGHDWASAYRDLYAALEAWTDEKTEIWIAGDWEISGSLPMSFSAPVAVRGGFTGVETSAAGRPANALTTLDGLDLAGEVRLTAAASVELERIRFVRMTTHALSKTGAGDLALTTCHFATNGWTNNGSPASVQGFGARISGGRATVSNCLFIANGSRVATSGQLVMEGGAVYAESCAGGVEIVDCAFRGNGIPLGASADAKSLTRGVAVFVSGSVLTMRRCEIVNNHGNSNTSNFTAPTGGANQCGGIVYLNGACDGSVIENCVFAGNSTRHCAVTWNQPGYFSGALMVRLANTNDLVSVGNCTFAYNITDGIQTPAGINVNVGSVAVSNTVFHHNVISGTNTARPDIYVWDNCKADVAWCMFDGTNTVKCRTSSATLNLGAGIVYGDPLLKTPTDAFPTLKTKASSGNVKDVIWFDPADAATKEFLETVDCHLEKKSPAIDTGDPKSAYGREPSPNGHRINMGAYGNTPWATMSPAGLMLLVR